MTSRPSGRNDTPIARATGGTGEIEVFPDRVRIRRLRNFTTFALGGMLAGDKDIFISNISSIQFKEAGVLTGGYIQFSFIGGQSAQGGLRQASHDENSVVFNGAKQEAAFRHVKEVVEDILLKHKTPSAAPTYLDELERLAALRERGALTSEEFEMKKKQILGLNDAGHR